MDRGFVQSSQGGIQMDVESDVELICERTSRRTRSCWGIQRQSKLRDTGIGDCPPDNSLERRHVVRGI